MRNASLPKGGDSSNAVLVVGFVVVAVSASMLATALRIEPVMVSRVIVVMLALLGYSNLINDGAPSRRELVVFGVFSFLFDVSLILGLHIEVGDGNPYVALKDDAYIIDYGISDIVLFLGSYPSVLLISIAAWRLPRLLKRRFRGCSSISAASVRPVPFVLFAAALFLAWLPYLVAYYPGLIFGDTLSSLAQATGVQSWSNHHPVLYTAFIALCLKIAGFFGLGNAAGCALYCIVQMMFLSGCFSYLSNWVISRFDVSRVPRIILSLLLFSYFGLTPYIATYGIAMWKDPIFSASIAVITILVADTVILGKRVSLGRAMVFAAFALISAFSRNNGIYIIALLSVCFLAMAVCWRIRARSLNAYRGQEAISGATSYRQKHIGGSRVSVLSSAGFAVVALYFVVTGPVYGALGIASSPSVESLGVPFNQMARVAAYDGDMTEEDREYLDAVFPIEQYADHYYPCCTDNLKWNAEFDGAALSDGFWTHWLSMLIRNPLAYFESWELQTFGFWTVNQPAVMSKTNILGGAPITVYPEYGQDLAAYGIDPSVATRCEELRELFPVEEKSIPVGVVLWLILHVLCCMIVERRYRWALALVPSLGLLLTLVIASPIWYWPRYGAAVQFLIPFFIWLYFALENRAKRACGRSQLFPDASIQSAAIR